MMLIMFILLSVVMMGVSISLYEVLRNSRPFGWFIFLIDSNPLTQFIFHFAIGLAILAFTGEGAIAGASDLATGVLFTFYCAIRNAISPGYMGISGHKMFRKPVYH